MQAFKIIGGTPLNGTVNIMGAKNAVLPLMTASLLTDDIISLKNVPFLSDVQNLMQLLNSFGCTISHEADSLTLQSNQITNTTASYEFVSKMRASFWVLGPLLSRFHKATVSLPGGCAIGARPVDLYLMALRQMGAKIDIQNGYVIASGKLHGADIYFPKISVGATHNTLMAAVLAKGTTRIYNPAFEPEVMDLITLLKKMGANITGVGTKILTIHGVKELHGAEHTVIPDRIETATFAIAAGITKGRILMKNARLDLMESVAELLAPSHIQLTQQSDDLLVDATQAHLQSVPVTTQEYPGFPTDVQAPMTALLSVAEGESVVSEHIFENRFMHVPELERMGAHITQLNAHTVLIKGVANLSGAPVMASDLRGGVALVLAALAATGETIVSRIYHIDRGYFELERKLNALGADIQRIQSAL